MSNKTKRPLENLPEFFQNLLSCHDNDIDLIEADQPLKTAEAAAQYCDLPVSSVIKTLLLKAKDGRYICVVMRGSEALDDKKLRAYLGAKKLRFLNGDEVQTLTQFIAGGVPPIGMPEDFINIMDQRVTNEPVIIGGGGRPEILLKASPESLIKINSHTVLDLAK